MSNSGYSRFYRQLSQKILNTIVTPQVLGNTSSLAQQWAQSTHCRICYVLQDASLSNTVLIDEQAQNHDLPSVFSPLQIGSYTATDSMLVLNEPKNNYYHYSAKLIALIEALEQHPEYDILLVPISMLWGRAPESENSWLKALFADAWSSPSSLKQGLNIALYSHDQYLEFHPTLSLKALIQTAKTEKPHFSPAHFIVQHLQHDFNQYKAAILGPDLSDRRQIIHKLLQSDVIKQAVIKESIEQKLSLFAAENRARQYLNEISSDFSYATLRFAELALTKLWTQLYDGIEVHHFEKIRHLAKDYTLVYTPCHRSHIDYLLLSFVIFNKGLMVPHIAAGINLNLPFVGQLFRGVGAYFIRRSFNGNELYTTVFKEYLHSLLARNTPLEYFIEGGRSRTGLLLPAKKGMLSMTIQSHLRGAGKPIVFIPTYFSYEKLLEGSSYLNELNGRPKEAESLWGILSSVRKIEKVFGQVHVNFAEPIFLDQLLQHHNAEHIQLKPQQELPSSVVNTVNQVADNILENINKAVVINPVSLIALTLLNSEQHQLSEKELILYLQQLCQMLHSLPYDQAMIISELSATQMIEYALKLKQIERIPQQEQNVIQVLASQKVLLNYFSNNILHCFIFISVVVLALKQPTLLNYTKLKQLLDMLYPYLKTSFFLKWSVSEIGENLQNILAYLQTLGLIHLEKEHIVLIENSPHQSYFSFLANLAKPTLHNALVMTILLHQYTLLDTSLLEKMSKIVLQRLYHQQQIQVAYLDKTSIQSLITSLLNEKIIIQQDNIFICQSNFDNFLDYLKMLLPSDYQKIRQASIFNNNEINNLRKNDIK